MALLLIKRLVATVQTDLPLEIENEFPDRVGMVIQWFNSFNPFNGFNPLT